MKTITILLIIIFSFLIPLALISVLAALRMSGLCSEAEREEEEMMRKTENNKENKE